MEYDVGIPDGTLSCWEIAEVALYELVTYYFPEERFGRNIYNADSIMCVSCLKQSL